MIFEWGRRAGSRGLRLRDYMIRVDDTVTCKTCGKKFDILSQHSMVLLQTGVPEHQRR